ncbi:hypothetical protein Mal48_13610 [Thalassoglobus polymorphus]|uniref:Uncharacterized protein n=1 Tax=Thalassoglobus polymorphus TaxID=2527994 RepID=A0A517QKF1_9PLAN|nr:hypothetical protein Mal48_13610 [Thalassoglobus polymorphus]
MCVDVERDSAVKVLIASRQNVNISSKNVIAGRFKVSGYRILELVLKLEIALSNVEKSNVEKSDDSRGSRTGSKAVCSTVCP